MRAAALPLLLLAAAGPADDPPVVVTHGTARERLPNTVADVQLGLEAHARSLADVRNALATGSTGVLAVLTAAGAERVQTQSLTVQPEVEPDPPRGRAARILGYSGTLSITFRTVPDKLGGILADALAHGANTVQNTTQHPLNTEIDAARIRLATAATRIAMAEARAVAEAAGMRPGPARHIEVTVDGSDLDLGTQPVARPAVLNAAAAPRPIATAAGDTDLAATVTVTVTLLEP